MGKSKRNQVSAEEKNAARMKLANEKSAADKKAKKKKILIIAAVVVAVVVIAALVVVSLLDSNGVFMRNTPVLSTEHCTVDQAMLSYYTYTAYENFASTYSSWLSALGLDTSLSLKSQEMSTGYTWFSYFENTAVTQLRELLIYAEAAKAEGVQLDEENTKAVDDTMAAMKEVAKSAGYNLSQYTAAMYGAGVKSQDVRRCLELSYLASQYVTSVTDEFDFSDTEITDYYTENATNYQYVDYLSYTLTPVTSDLDQTAETYEDDLAARQAEYKAMADELAACKDEAAFTAWVENYLKTVVYKDDAEDNADAITTALGKLASTKIAYASDSEVSEWLFGEDKDHANDLNSTYVLTTTAKAYTVYLLTATPYRDEAVSTVTVYDLLFKTSDYDSAEDKANEILAQFEAATKDGAAFDAIAKELNVTTYKYTDISSTDTTVDSNVLTWGFDTERKAGDYTVTKADTGYHFSYLDSVSEDTVWEASIRSQLTSDKLDEVFKSLQEKYSLTVDQNAIDQLAR